MSTVFTLFPSPFSLSNSSRVPLFSLKLMSSYSLIAIIIYLYVHIYDTYVNL